MSAAIVLLGALVGFGLLLVLLGLRGEDLADLRPRRQVARQAPQRSIDRLPLRMALAVVAGAAIGILTQWPVAALLVGIGAFMAPSVIGGRAEREHAMSVIEDRQSVGEGKRVAGSGDTGGCREIKK